MQWQPYVSMVAHAQCAVKEHDKIIALILLDVDKLSYWLFTKLASFYSLLVMTSTPEQNSIPGFGHLKEYFESY